ADTKKPGAFAPGFYLFLNNACFLEGGVCAILLNVLHALNGNVHDDHLLELGDVDAALGDIGLAADLADRVELRSTGTVRVPPAYLGRFAGYNAFTCHSPRMLPYLPRHAIYP